MGYAEKKFKIQVPAKNKGGDGDNTYRSLRNRRFKKYDPGSCFITKSSGKTETFSKGKLKRSLLRTGLSQKTCSQIVDQIAGEVRNGEKTSEIYRKALSLVKQKSPLASVRYSLKKSLLELGPEGHYFEDFVAKYFERIGFKVSVCKTLQGKYIRHEVDCIAEKGQDKYYSECKFHNRAGTKNDIKIALYVKARWDDLKDGPEGKNLKGYYLFSNTAFTIDSLTYAQGTGLKLMGVNAPSEKSFLDTIKEMKLYPLTSLRNLSKSQKHHLLSKKLILADELTVEVLFKAGIEEAKVFRIMEEVKAIKRMQT